MSEEEVLDVATPQDNELNPETSPGEGREGDALSGMDAPSGGCRPGISGPDPVRKRE